MSDNARYYVIEGTTATWHATWEAATAHYLQAGGKAVITEVVPVAMAVVRTPRTPRANGRMATRDGTKSDAASKLLLDGEPPMRVVESTGLSRQAVYDIRTRLVRRGLLRPLREVRP